jgi:hypothetical protein
MNIDAPFVFGTRSTHQKCYGGGSHDNREN